MLFKVQLHIVWQYAQTWRFFVFGNVVNYLKKGSFKCRSKDRNVLVVTFLMEGTKR